MQICTFLILHTSCCCCRAEHMDIFLHALIFHMLSELKLFPSHFPEYCGAPEHFNLVYLPQKDDFLLVDKVRVLCFGFCVTGSHSITYLLSMLDIQQG